MNSMACNITLEIEVKLSRLYILQVPCLSLFLLLPFPGHVCALDFPSLGIGSALKTLENKRSDYDDAMSQVTSQTLNPFTASRGMCASDSLQTCAAS